MVGPQAYGIPRGKEAYLDIYSGDCSDHTKIMDVSQVRKTAMMAGGVAGKTILRNLLGGQIAFPRQRQWHSFNSSDTIYLKIDVDML